MKLALIFINALIIPGTVYGGYLGLVTLVQNKPLLYPLVFGFVLGIVVYQLVIRRLKLFKTFEHEFTHALVALCFFNRIDEFVFTGDRGGYVRYSGGGAVANLPAI